MKRIELPCWAIWSPVTCQFVLNTLSADPSKAIEKHLSSFSLTWQELSEAGWECRQLKCYWEQP